MKRLDPPSTPPLTRAERRREHAERAWIHWRDVEFERLRGALRRRLEAAQTFRADITVHRMLRIKPYSSEARRADMELSGRNLLARCMAGVLSHVPRLTRSRREAMTDTPGLAALPSDLPGLAVSPTHVPNAPPATEQRPPTVEV